MNPRGLVAPAAGPWGRWPGVRWVPGAGGRWQVSRQTGSGGCRQRTGLGAGSHARLDVSSAGVRGGEDSPSVPQGPGPLTLHPPAEMSPSMVAVRWWAWQTPRGAAAPALPAAVWASPGTLRSQHGPVCRGTLQRWRGGWAPLGCRGLYREGAVGTEPQLGREHGCPHGIRGNCEDGWGWGAEGQRVHQSTPCQPCARRCEEPRGAITARAVCCGAGPHSSLGRQLTAGRGATEPSHLHSHCLAQTGQGWASAPAW